MASTAGAGAVVAVPVRRLRDWHDRPVTGPLVTEAARSSARGAAGAAPPAPVRRPSTSRQSAQQDTGTAAAQQQARQNVDVVRRRINGLTGQALERVARLYREGGRQLAEQLHAIIDHYGGETTWAATAPISAQRRAQRLHDLLQQADDAIQLMATAAGDETTQAAIAAYRMSYYGTAWALDALLPLGVAARAPLLAHQAVVAAIAYPYQGMTYLERYSLQRPAVLIELRHVIAHSQLAGDSVSQATSRFLRTLGVPVGGPLPVAQRRQAAADALNVPPVRRGMTPRKHAELIVRTELSRSSAVAAEAIYDHNAEVLAGKVWLAAHDRRVCPICQALDGTTYALNDEEAPTIPRHPRCRCAWAPQTRSFAELGLRGLAAAEPKPRQTYADWAESRGIAAQEDGGLATPRGRGRAPQDHTAG